MDYVIDIRDLQSRIRRGGHKQLHNYPIQMYTTHLTWTHSDSEVMFYTVGPKQAKLNYLELYAALFTILSIFTVHFMAETSVKTK